MARNLTLEILLYFYIIFFTVNYYADAFADVEKEFHSFIKKFGKHYTNETKQYWYRLANFKKTLIRIEKLNQNRKFHHEAQYGVTQFADLSPEEFQFKVLQFSGKKKKSPFNNVKHKRAISNSVTLDIPLAVDWRTKKVITGVKNQKSCGACWAFSTVETIETMKAMKTGVLKELSVQQLIDCAKEGNYGCLGGDTCTVLVWLNKTDTVVVEESQYPLTDVTGTCKNLTSSFDARIQSNFTCLRYVDNEIKMLELLATHGPLVAAVDATSWQDYLGGIIQFHCDTFTNHAVQIVGYDQSGEIPYYIVRNSWGPQYGLDGYLHIAVGKDLCGIAQQVSYLDVK